MKILDPEKIRIISRCRLLFWKALLIRKNTVFFTLLELIIPVILTLQIRLIFHSLSLNPRTVHHTQKMLYDYFPKTTECWFAPKNEFTDKLMSKVSKKLEIPVYSEMDEKKLVRRHFSKNNTSNMFWVIFQSSEYPIPKVFDYTIRSSEIGKIPMVDEKDKDPMDVDPYLQSGFLGLQSAIEFEFLKLWTNAEIKDIDMIMERVPFYKINFLTFSSINRPSVSIIYYMSIIAFIFLPLSTLTKLIHEKESGFTDLLRISGINNCFLYFGWITYLCVTAIPVTIICTFLLYPIYSKSINPVEIGIFLMCHILVTSTVMFAIGSFFTSTTKAVLTCFLCWIFMARITMEFNQFFEKQTFGIKILSLFLPHNGLLYGIAALSSKIDIGNLQSAETDRSKINNINKDLDISEDLKNIEQNDEVFSVKTTVSLTLVLVSWFLHIIFWLVITIYLDNVTTGKFGSKKPWFYPCQKKIRKVEVTHFSHKGSTNWNAVEPVSSFLKPVIRVRNLTKKFGSLGTRIIGVNNMTINFYRKEFNVILGHNGAGKSTFLKLLVGLYKPSQGHIYVEEDDPKIKSLYSEIGFCGQENILVDYLTVLQHIYLFGMVKGLSYKNSLKESRKLLKQLNLEEERNSQVRNLNFGVKRRVCIAMALIGDIKILILDEPNYGFDPVHEKRIFNLLSKLKGKITVIMSTNTMEAADNIADRIVIFVHGKVECYGSKMFLNRHYGIGYVLSMVYQEECDLNLLRDEVQEFSSEPVTQRDIMARVVKYNIPRRSQVTKLLDYLELSKERLKITSVSIKAAGIEGQFLKIGLISQFKDRGAFFIGNDYELMVKKRRRDLLNSGDPWERLKGRELTKHQFVAILYKKLLHIAWSWKLYLFCIILTMITFAITMTLLNLEKESLENGEIYLNVSKYTDSNFLLLLQAAKGEISEKFLTSLTTVSQSYDKVKNYHISMDIPATRLMSNSELHSIEFRDRYFLAIDILESGGVKISYSSYALHSSPIALNLLYNSLLREYGCEDCKIILKSHPLVDPKQWQHHVTHPQEIRNWVNAAIIISLLLILPSIDLGIREKISLSKQLQLNTSGMNTFIYWIPNYVLDLILYTLSLIVVSLVCYFFYYEEIRDFSPVAFVELLSIFLFYGAAAIPLNYCLQLLPVKIRTVYLIVYLINILVVLLHNVSILLPLLTHYLNETEKYIFEIALHLFPPYALGCAIRNYISLFIHNYQCKKHNTCDTDYRFEDPCCQNCDDPEKYCFKFFNLLKSRKSDYHSVLHDMIALLFQAIVFNILLQIFEKKNLRKWILHLKKRTNSLFDFEKKKLPEIIIESVETLEQKISEEKQKCAELMKEFEETRHLRPEVSILVQSLTKQYGKQMVIQGIDFTVNQKECFGLLGMNSTGKSTILKILAGETNITTGNAVIQKYQLETNSDKFLGLVGYCPQYGGLNNYLTGRQNLTFFSLIRGIPYENIRREVDKWMDIFDLLEYENKQIINCVWGIQRKICILQSLIGDLPILYLDNPSAGIDALSKHALFEVLNETREMGRSLLITTHNIQDVEALCFRVSILREGKLITIGTFEDLKSMYGNNFILNIKLNSDEELDSLEDIKFIIYIILETFPDIIFKESSLEGTLTFEIPRHIDYNNVSTLLYDLSQKYSSIEDFSLNQPTLEQIFIELSKTTEIQNERDVLFHFFDYLRGIFYYLFRIYLLLQKKL